MIQFYEPVPELLSRSKLLVLDFRQIDKDTPPTENMAQYFKTTEAKGMNPRLPEYRQAFNNTMLDSTGVRYAVSRYGEDRLAMLEGSAIAKEGRTIHLGIDIFSRDLEPVSAPCDGTIVRVGREPESHSFGNYVILQPKTAGVPYIFFGHLGNKLPSLGAAHRGQIIAELGDYHDNINGGWSRHLHLQLLRDLPPIDTAPPGYATAIDFLDAKQYYPDPMPYFLNWSL